MYKVLSTPKESVLRARLEEGLSYLSPLWPMLLNMGPQLIATLLYLALRAYIWNALRQVSDDPFCVDYTCEGNCQTGVNCQSFVHTINLMGENGTVVKVLGDAFPGADPTQNAVTSPLCVPQEMFDFCVATAWAYQRGVRNQCFGYLTSLMNIIKNLSPDHAMFHQKNGLVPGKLCIPKDLYQASMKGQIGRAPELEMVQCLPETNQTVPFSFGHVAACSQIYHDINDILVKHIDRNLPISEVYRTRQHIQNGGIVAMGLSAKYITDLKKGSPTDYQLAELAVAMFEFQMMTPPVNQFMVPPGRTEIFEAVNTGRITVVGKAGGKTHFFNGFDLSKTWIGRGLNYLLPGSADYTFSSGIRESLALLLLSDLLPTVVGTTLSTGILYFTRWQLGFGIKQILAMLIATELSENDATESRLMCRLIALVLLWATIEKLRFILLSKTYYLKSRIKQSNITSLSLIYKALSVYRNDDQRYRVMLLLMSDLSQSRRTEIIDTLCPEGYRHSHALKELRKEDLLLILDRLKVKLLKSKEESTRQQLVQSFVYRYFESDLLDTSDPFYNQRVKQRVLRSPTRKRQVKQTHVVSKPYVNKQMLDALMHQVSILAVLIAYNLFWIYVFSIDDPGKTHV